VKRYRKFIEFNEPEGSTPEMLSSFVSLAINGFLGIYPSSLKTGWV
jgi:hypothetical protein